MVVQDFARNNFNSIPTQLTMQGPLPQHLAATARLYGEEPGAKVARLY